VLPSAVSAAHAMWHSTSDGSVRSAACAMLTLRLTVRRVLELSASAPRLRKSEFKQGAAEL